jgi:purine-binding chemotaxis protein CheW
MPSPLTDVIILKLSSCVMGMVVDGVSGVVTLAADQISPLPPATGMEPADYLIGVGRVGARRLILVDIDKLMSIQRGDALQSREVA